MPFLSRSQARACFAKNDPDWNCKEWAGKTKSIKKLPERVKKAMFESFTKIAKELFNPKTSPPIPARVIQQQSIQSAKQDKTKGMSPVEYRNEMTSRRTGIISKNRQSNKAA